MSQQPPVNPESPEPVPEPAPVSEAISPVEMARAAAGTPEPATPELVPGAGAPLVSGPPSSVRGGADAAKVNTYFGVAAVVLLVITVIVVILLAILVFSLTRPR